MIMLTFLPRGNSRTDKHYSIKVTVTISFEQGLNIYEWQFLGLLRLELAVERGILPNIETSGPAVETSQISSTEHSRLLTCLFAKSSGFNSFALGLQVSRVTKEKKAGFYSPVSLN